MTKNASLLRLQAKPGKRDEVRRIWEKYARDHTAGDKGILSFYYCYDNDDPDAVIVFGLVENASAQAFARQSWFADYQRETLALLAAPPEIRRATTQYVKDGA